jgi:hypothetical protein
MDAVKSFSMRPVAWLAVLLTFAGSIPVSLGLCEYWGVEIGCSYDGRYEKPMRCQGMGRRYCDRAPEVKECPEACQYQVVLGTHKYSSNR